MDILRVIVNDAVDRRGMVWNHEYCSRDVLVLLMDEEFLIQSEGWWSEVFIVINIFVYV